jgi:hypothetical protein
MLSGFVKYFVLIFYKKIMAMELKDKVSRVTGVGKQYQQSDCSQISEEERPCFLQRSGC